MVEWRTQDNRYPQGRKNRYHKEDVAFRNRYKRKSPSSRRRFVKFLYMKSATKRNYRRSYCYTVSQQRCGVGLMYHSSSNIPHVTQSVGSRSEFATPLPLRNKIGTSNDMKPWVINSQYINNVQRKKKREKRKERKEKRAREARKSVNKINQSSSILEFLHLNCNTLVSEDRQEKVADLIERSNAVAGTLCELHLVVPTQKAGSYTHQELHITSSNGIKYLLIYSGRTKGAASGVGVFFRIDHKFNIERIYAISDRVIKVDFSNERYSRKFSLTAAYSPTNTKKYSLRERSQFYDQLQKGHDTTKEDDRINVVAGDFNARIAFDASLAKNMGKFGAAPYTNQNGQLLVDFVVKNRLEVSNTRFKAKRNDGYGTFYHRSSHQTFMLDYWLVPKKFAHLVQKAGVDKNNSLVEEKDHYAVRIRLDTSKFFKKIKDRFPRKILPRLVPIYCGPLAGEVVNLNAKHCLNIEGLIYDKEVNMVPPEETANLPQEEIDRMNVPIRDITGEITGTVISQTLERHPNVPKLEIFDYVLSEIQKNVKSCSPMLKENKVGKDTPLTKTHWAICNDKLVSQYDYLRETKIFLKIREEKFQIIRELNIAPTPDLWLRLKQTLKLLKTALRKAKRAQALEYARGLMKFDGTRQTKLLYDSFNRLTFGNKSNNIEALRSSNGVVVKDNVGKIQICKEYAEQLLNAPSIAQNDIDLGPDKACAFLTGRAFTMEDLIIALKNSPLGKAGGANITCSNEMNEMLTFEGEIEDFPIEIIKYANDNKDILQFILDSFNEILNDTINGSPLPDSLQKSLIIFLHKKKDKTDPSNYRTLTLNGAIYKLFMRMLVIRILEYCENNSILPEAQHGFRTNRNCNQANYILNTIRNSCLKFGIDLYACYIDLKKAYDTVDRELLWKILKYIGLAPNLIAVIKALYDNSFSAIRLNGEISEFFSTSTGLKQGCPLAPLLFIIFFSIVNEHVERELEATRPSRDYVDGVKWVYKCTDELVPPNGFDQQHGILRNDNEETLIRVIRDISYADDVVAFSNSRAGLQRQVEIYFRVFRKFGLQMALDKTEIQFFRNSVSALQRLPINMVPQNVEKLPDAAFVMKDPEIFITEPNGTI